jgi:hypothetical protein
MELSKSTLPRAHADEMGVELVLGIGLLRDAELSKFS